MKILQIIKEEVVPLSSRQNLVLFIIIACVFQFALFYAPVLADEAVKQAETAAAEAPDAKAAENKQDAQESALMANNAITLETNNTPDNKESASPEPSISIKILRTSTHVITAYNSEPGQTDADPCTTANGYNVCQSEQEDTIAANFLKFGTKVMIPELFGERIFIVRDRMNKRHANRVDVWMKDYDDAIHFGVKVAKIQVIE